MLRSMPGLGSCCTAKHTHSWIILLLNAAASRHLQLLSCTCTLAAPSGRRLHSHSEGQPSPDQPSADRLPPHWQCTQPPRTKPSPCSALTAAHIKDRPHLVLAPAAFIKHRPILHNTFCQMLPLAGTELRPAQPCLMTDWCELTHSSPRAPPPAHTATQPQPAKAHLLVPHNWLACPQVHRADQRCQAMPHSRHQPVASLQQQHITTLGHARPTAGANGTAEQLEACGEES